MDITQFSDPHPLLSNTWSIDHHKQESPSSLLSDACTATRKAHSDEEEVALLASSRPKKRAGRRIFKETRHPIFRGVRRRNNNKWVCELREPNKKSRIWLGTYPTPEMAARAHDVAALAFRGKSACLNFADSSWRLPVPVSNESKDIRRAASEAAELFRPQEFGGEVRQTVNEEDSSEACSSDIECRALEDRSLYMDEEAEFNMPALLANLAEGLLLPPPRYIGESVNWDDMESDVSLWSFSI